MKFPRLVPGTISPNSQVELVKDDSSNFKPETLSFSESSV